MYKLSAIDEFGIAAECEVETISDVYERVSEMVQFNLFLKENDASPDLLIKRVEEVNDFGELYVHTL